MARIFLKVAGLAAAVSGLASMGGCPQASCESGDPTALAAVAAKVTGCQMQAITACEFKLLVKTASDASPEIDASLTDEEAQAAVDFVALNNIKCFEDLQAIYDCVQVDPSCAQIPDSLQKLIDSENAK